MAVVVIRQGRLYRCRVTCAGQLQRHNKVAAIRTSDRVVINTYPGQTTAQTRHVAEHDRSNVIRASSEHDVIAIGQSCRVRVRTISQVLIINRQADRRTSYRILAVFNADRLRRAALITITISDRVIERCVNIAARLVKVRVRIKGPVPVHVHRVSAIGIAVRRIRTVLRNSRLNTTNSKRCHCSAISTLRVIRQYIRTNSANRIFSYTLCSIISSCRNIVNDSDREGVFSNVTIKVSYDNVERDRGVITISIIAQSIFIHDCTVAGYRIIGDRSNHERAGCVVDDDLVISIVTRIVAEVNLDTVDCDAVYAIRRIESDCRASRLTWI